MVNAIVACVLLVGLTVALTLGISIPTDNPLPEYVKVASCSYKADGPRIFYDPDDRAAAQAARRACRDPSSSPAYAETASSRPGAAWEAVCTLPEPVEGSTKGTAAHGPICRLVERADTLK